MTLTIREVKSDDWSWLYIQGECTNTEGVGHDLQPCQLVDAINTYIMENSFGTYVRQFGKIDFKSWDIDGKYAENSMPKYLSDIPEEVWI